MKINFSIKPNGGFQIWRSPKNLTMIAGNRNVSISFPIINDNVYKPEAELTITLHPSIDSSYNLSTNNRATIKINDKEDKSKPNNPTPDDQPRISVASAVVSALTQELLAESTPLEVSIVAESPSIEVGNSANFIISSNPATTVNQTINLLVERINSEISEINNETVLLHAGQNTVKHTINTGDSDFNYSNGTISVQVMAGPNYSIPTDLERSKASVAILDNHEIASPSKEIIEAGEQIHGLIQSKINESALNVLKQRSTTNSGANPSTSFTLSGGTNIQNFITNYGNMLNEDGSKLAVNSKQNGL